MSKRDELFKQGVANPAFAMFTNPQPGPEVEPEQVEKNPEPAPQPKRAASQPVKQPRKNTAPSKERAYEGAAASSIPNSKGRATRHFMIREDISAALDMRLMNTKRFYRGLTGSDIVNSALEEYLADELNEIHAKDDQQ